MSLPELIEIVPLDSPVHAEVTVPGSKSITNRALLLAALADGETTLSGALWSEDTQVMVDCLQELGFMVNVAPDPDEPCNRTITVYGLGGAVPRGGTAGRPLELFVGNAGTAARFLSAMICLGDGVYRVHGVPRMHERPQAALFQALRELGYQIDSENDRLPALVHGTGPKPGAKCQVSIHESSQFASALILAAPAGGWQISVTGENAEESPYVYMTSEMCSHFRRDRKSGTYGIDPDSSSGSYFFAAGWIVNQPGQQESHPVMVSRWPIVGRQFQIDTQFSNFWPLPAQLSRLTDLGDAIMTAIVVAPFAGHPVRFTDLGRLRLQECERVEALRTELSRCGARVTEAGDTLKVFPSPLHGATIETYHDHRMAMCFAILGLKVAGIKIKNPACVKKTFPNFFQKLAAAPPHGLGAQILDGAGKPLGHDELFAE
ncbi:MAG: 3-phosphoshikimate 1-carboxyvinyltransferase [Verrucomicrobiota bacterium]|jgi:3-phosphoshikimate 1-carboxyvinyltransferase